MSEELTYNLLPTLEKFHNCGAQMRAVVGPVGSGKTTGASWEICHFLPFFLYKQYGITSTRWVIVRNTYSELIDTTQRTVFEWFPWGDYKTQSKNYYLSYPEPELEIELMFRSCDRPQDVKKFKSLEVTGYWIDESIEVADEIKRMLKNRIGRYPRKCPVRFGIETTNPPDVEHVTYTQFAWDTPPPGPISDKKPLKNHTGFWQPPRENNANLRPGYYDDLLNDYADTPDWIEMYVEGKPGVLVTGKLVYNNFSRDKHVAQGSLIYAGGDIIVGWDNSGNTPAAVVCQEPSPQRLQVLAEYNTVKENIVDFTTRVLGDVRERYSKTANIIEWADPAGEAKFSTKEGGFTSNAKLMRDECGSNPQSSEQNLQARIEGVEKLLRMEDGLLIDPSCTRLINGFLGGYCYPEIGNTGTFSDKPDKNRFSHCHDALQYVAVRVALGDARRRFDPLDIDSMIDDS